MKTGITLTTKQILNLCEFAGIVIDQKQSVLTEEPDQLETEYAIEQNKYGAIAYLEEYPEEGAYPLSGLPHFMKNPHNQSLEKERAKPCACWTPIEGPCGKYCEKCGRDESPVPQA